jgi:hypothetical protein
MLVEHPVLEAEGIAEHGRFRGREQIVADRLFDQADQGERAVGVACPEAAALPSRRRTTTRGTKPEFPRGTGAIS